MRKKITTGDVIEIFTVFTIIIVFTLAYKSFEQSNRDFYSFMERQHRQNLEVQITMEKDLVRLHNKLMKEGE